MSNKKLVKNIAKNSIDTAIAAAIADFMDAHDTITNSARANIIAMDAWKRVHDYDTIAAAARGKNAKNSDKNAFERLKAARADYAEIIRADAAETCKPARATMTAARVRIFGRGGKNDKSTRACAFNQFYAAYTEYRKEYAANANTPAGNAARKALNNLWSACFGFTFVGGIANDISRRTLNAIGIRIANTRENMRGADGIAVFNETQVKNMLVYIAVNLINRGIVDAEIHN